MTPEEYAEKAVTVEAMAGGRLLVRVCGLGTYTYGDQDAAGTAAALRRHELVVAVRDYHAQRLKEALAGGLVAEGRLGEIKARLGAATGGPWSVYERRLEPTEAASELPRGAPDIIERRVVTAWDHPQLGGPAPVVTTGHSPYVAPNVHVSIRREDAEFIAASRQDVEDLLALTGRLAAQNLALDGKICDLLADHARLVEEGARRERAEILALLDRMSSKASEDAQAASHAGDRAEAIDCEVACNVLMGAESAISARGPLPDLLPGEEWRRRCAELEAERERLKEENRRLREVPAVLPNARVLSENSLARDATRLGEEVHLARHEMDDPDYLTYRRGAVQDHLFRALSQAVEPGYWYAVRYEAEQAPDAIPRSFGGGEIFRARLLVTPLDGGAVRAERAAGGGRRQ